MDYGQRTCLQCHEPFMAVYASQVTCGAGCRLERAKYVRRESERRRIAKRREYVEGLENRIIELEQQTERLQRLVDDGPDSKVEDLLEEIREKDMEIARLKADLEIARAAKLTAIADSTQGSSPLSADVSDIALDTCERMSLRANSLPCGKREECYHPATCEKAPDFLEPGELTCPVCQQVFTPKHPRQKYCTKACTVKAQKLKLYRR